MWPFKRKRWENLGSAWTSDGVRSQILIQLQPEHIFLRDNDFQCLPQKDFERLVFDCWFPKDYRKYRAEIWDCDNWVIAFMAAVQKRWAKVSKGKRALAFGYIASKPSDMGFHGFIWMMDDKGIIHLYEPQRDIASGEWKPVLEWTRFVES